MPRGDAKGTAVVFKPGLVDKGEAGSSCNRVLVSCQKLIFGYYQSYQKKQMFGLLQFPYIDSTFH